MTSKESHTFYDALPKVCRVLRMQVSDMLIGGFLVIRAHGLQVLNDLPREFSIHPK